MTTWLVLACIALTLAGVVLAVSSWRLGRTLRAERATTAQLHRTLSGVEAEATRLERVRRDFVANISHELRTPLASIKLLVETLEAGALEDPPIALTFTRKIGAEANHLIAMAEELLSLARLESLPVMQPRALDPAEMIAGAIERMRELAARKGVALRGDVPALLPCVWADEAQVGRVFVNLLANALAFTPEGGVVIVGACIERDAVAFSVSDSGPGIPGGEEERIFERFYKADAARQGGGTGLGLSIARHIVAAQDGHIWARNGEDVGACFTFTLPIVATATAGAPGRPSRR